MTLLGTRLLIKAPEKGEEKNGIIMPDSVEYGANTYIVGYIGEDVDDERLRVGAEVMLTDSTIAQRRNQTITVNETEYILIDQSNVIAFP